MIYLDHSATTPVDPRVLKTMLPYFSRDFGNASSIYSLGEKSASAVENSRKLIAKFLDASVDEIIFTSGSTESNNLAIKGLVKSLGCKGIHVISDMVEHPAVLAPIAQLEKKGVISTIVGVSADGRVDLLKLKNAIRPNTRLVSIMYVNSEVGAINDIRKISSLIRAENKKRSAKERIYFHTDATQALNFLNCGVHKLGVDMLSLSGHKIYGPKGVGALYIRKGTPIQPLISGGHHERNLRSGTLNVPGIVGLGRAISLLSSADIIKQNKKIGALRDYLIARVRKSIPDIRLNTNTKVSTPSHANISFLGVEGESILLSLDLKGICVSTGSACASKSLKASHVLVAMGVPVEIAHNSVRFTLGKNTTKAEIDRVLAVLPSIVAKLRKMNPLYKK